MHQQLGFYGSESPSDLETGGDVAQPLPPDALLNAHIEHIQEGQVCIGDMQSRERPFMQRQLDFDGLGCAPSLGGVVSQSLPGGPAEYVLSNDEYIGGMFSRDSSGGLRCLYPSLQFEGIERYVEPGLSGAVGLDFSADRGFSVSVGLEDLWDDLSLNLEGMGTDPVLSQALCSASIPSTSCGPVISSKFDGSRDACGNAVARGAQVSTAEVDDMGGRHLEHVQYSSPFVTTPVSLMNSKRTTAVLSTESGFGSHKLISPGYRHCQPIVQTISCFQPSTTQARTLQGRLDESKTKESGGAVSRSGRINLSSKAPLMRPLQQATCSSQGGLKPGKSIVVTDHVAGPVSEMKGNLFQVTQRHLVVKAARKNRKRLATDSQLPLDQLEHIHRERVRRDDFACKMASLEILLPKSYKRDRVSVVHDAVQYVKMLQREVKILQENFLEAKRKASRLPRSVVKNLGMPKPLPGPVVKSTLKSSRNEGENCKLGSSIRPDIRERQNVCVEFHVQLDNGWEQAVEVLKCQCRPIYLSLTMRTIEELQVDLCRCSVTKLRDYFICVLYVKTRSKSSRTEALTTTRFAARLQSAVKLETTA